MISRGEGLEPPYVKYAYVYVEFLWKVAYRNERESWWNNSATSQRLMCEMSELIGGMFSWH